MGFFGGGGGGGGLTIMQGTIGARPATPPNANTAYFATDSGGVGNGELFIPTPSGSAWQSIGCSTNGTFVTNQLLFNGGGSFAYLLQRDGGNGDINLNNAIEAQGHVAVRALGSGILIKEGANGKQQTCGPMVAGSVTVANTSVTANSKIYPMRGPGGTNPGAWTVTAVVVGTSFTIGSTNAADTGSGWYTINEPG